MMDKEVRSKGCSGNEDKKDPPYALDFSSIPKFELQSSKLDDEWDTHRVYFNEFLVKNHSKPEDAAFQPFEFISEAVEVVPLTTCGAPPPTNDNVLDPLGWPHMADELATEEEPASDFFHDREADDDDLLGNGFRPSEDYRPDAPAKHYRLAQYAVEEPDEASLADKSSSDDDDLEDDVVEDIAYQSQTDDGSDGEDSELFDFLTQDLKRSQISVASADNSATEYPSSNFLVFPVVSPPAVEIDSHEQELQVTSNLRDEVHGGTQMSESILGGETPEVFEVVWDKARTSGNACPDQAVPPSSQTPTVVSIPLLKPPPKERLRKWLNEKSC